MQILLISLQERSSHHILIIIKRIISLTIWKTTIEMSHIYIDMVLMG
jgi:hypothetical protein